MTVTYKQPIRKSNRIRSLTAKASTNNFSFLVPQKESTSAMQNKRSSDQDSQPQPTTKRRKRSYIEEEEALHNKDKIDPVEKLLSLTSTNNDFLLEIESEDTTVPHKQQQQQQQLNQPQSHPHYAYELSSEEEEEEVDEEELDEHIGIASVNFTEILNDNIRRYYRNRLQNQYKDSFALLNNKRVEDLQQQQQQQQHHHQQQQSQPQSQSQHMQSNETTFPSVPFFRSVNLGSPKKEYSVEDYLTYGDEEEEEEGGQSPKSLPTATTGSESLSTSTTSLTSLMSLSEDEEDPHSQIVSPISSPSTTSSSLYTPENNKATTNDITTSSNTVSSTSSNWQFKPKINFNYWRLRNNQYNDNYNNGFSFNGGDDVSNALKQHSLYTATSEMVSTGNFMINDFYL